MMFSGEKSAFSKRNRRAVIIGGSMSGLFSAAFLRQIGWDVDVYERSKVELVGAGRAWRRHYRPSGAVRRLTGKRRGD
jgi:2-polyprenyl-6-methoxyphenol hydroxylase-like FAD-dependent oxidoreductase